MDAQQELFTLLRQALVVRFGEDKVFDGFLPPEGTPYPFIYLSDAWQNDDANKSAIFGKVTVTVHVWHNDPNQRGTVSDIMLKIKQTAMSLKGTHFTWDYRNASGRVIHDNSTKQPLLHGIVELRLHFS